MLSGEGADSLMHFQMLPYARDLFRQREWGRLFTDSAGIPLDALDFRGREFANGYGGFSVRIVTLSRVPGLDLRGFGCETGPQDPDQACGRSVPFISHPIRSRPWLTLFFPSRSGPRSSNSPILASRIRPLRLVIHSWISELSTIYWLFRRFHGRISKRLLREAMVGRLPAAILRRPKTPLVEDPIQRSTRAPGCVLFGEIALG